MTLQETLMDQNLQPTPKPEGAFSRMKRILTSPLTKRKQAPAASQYSKSSDDLPSLTSTYGRSQTLPAPKKKYFGVPLDEVCLKDGNEIPKLVTMACDFITKHGLKEDGVMRVNGNAKVIESMKISFNTGGDGDFGLHGDVMSVAGLLKLFLRELPEGLITEQQTKAFIKVQESHRKDPDQSHVSLKQLLEEISPNRQAVLRYLFNFLTKVCEEQQYNQMHAQALGIVMGPCIFRCSDSMAAIKEHSVTNHITQQFITDFSFFFKNVSPKKGRPSPKRPAPPAPDPVAVTRNGKTANTATRARIGSEGDDDSRFSDPSDMLPVNGSEDDTIPLETDRSEFTMHSLETPRTPRLHSNSEEVAAAVSSVVGEHLFGDSDSSDEDTPVPAPRRKKQQQLQKQHQQQSGKGQTKKEDNSEKTTSQESINSRIKLFEQHSSPSHQGPVSKEFKTKGQKMATHIGAGDSGITPVVSTLQTQKSPERPSPSTGGIRKGEAFEKFEKQGIIIGMAPSNFRSVIKQNMGQDENTEERSPDRNVSPKAPPRKQKENRATDDSDDSGFNSIPRTEDTLAGFKRPLGPKNRRNPSRRSLRPTDVDEEMMSRISEEVVQPGDQSFSSSPEQRSPVRESRRVIVPVANSDEDSDQESPVKTPPTTVKKAPNVREKPSKKVTDTNILEDKQFLKSDISPIKKTPHTKPVKKAMETPPSDEKPNKTSSLKVSTPQDIPASKTYPGDKKKDNSPSPDAMKNGGVIPPLDLSILHENADGGEPILSEQDPLKVKSNGVMLSPRSMKQQQPSLSSDHNIAPSPPSEHYLQNRPVVSDRYSQQTKSLTKKIQGLKKKLKQYEEKFEEENGFRPSHTDKVADPDIKKVMQDLGKTRKDLKKLKEDHEAEVSGRISEMAPSSQRVEGSRDDLPRSSPPATMQDLRDSLLARLQEKRSEAGRPDELTWMSPGQIQEEKLALQKALLQFEGVHGRPTTPQEKEIMKPLYDRYRNVKKLLSKAQKGERLSLNPVPENSQVAQDSAKSSAPSPAKSTGKTTYESTIHLSTVDLDEDMKVTQEPSKTKMLGGGTKGKGKNLHEMSYDELVEEQKRLRNSKKHLRRLLQDLDEDTSDHQKHTDERGRYDDDHKHYKELKQRLKLVEALLSKYQDQD